ncbi:MAG: hypothetical protein WA014_03880 [Minisyncoccia bacterium]
MTDDSKSPQSEQVGVQSGHVVRVGHKDRHEDPLRRLKEEQQQQRQQ